MLLNRLASLWIKRQGRKVENGSPAELGSPLHPIGSDKANGGREGAVRGCERAVRSRK